jgi:hypothetical protein
MRATERRNWVTDDQGRFVKFSWEPDENTVRVVMGALLAVGALILIGLSINDFASSQGFLANLAGLSGHYVLWALIFAVWACAFAFASVMSLRAAYIEDQNRKRPRG